MRSWRRAIRLGRHSAFLCALNRSLLTEDEVAWLNAYHKRVRKTITPLVDAATAKWLEGATRAI